MLYVTVGIMFAVFRIINIEFLCLQVHNEYGNVITAAIGSPFCSSNFGMLKPTKATLNTTSNITLGLIFPEIRLHVFDVKQPFAPCIPKGPSTFEYQDMVYLTVARAVTVNIFGSTNLEKHDDIVLNGIATEFSATQAKKGNFTVMEVKFMWDEVNFKGIKDNNTNLTSLSATLTFTRKLKTYSLTGAEVTSATINGSQLTNNSLQVNNCFHLL